MIISNRNTADRNGQHNAEQHISGRHTFKLDRQQIQNTTLLEWHILCFKNKARNVWLMSPQGTWSKIHFLKTFSKTEHKCYRKRCERFKADVKTGNLRRRTLPHLAKPAYSCI